MKIISWNTAFHFVHVRVRGLLCLFSKFAKLTVIQIYSPSNEADEDDKDCYYEQQLQKELDTVPLFNII